MITFGPDTPAQVAADVNDWIAKHDLERYPITSNNFTFQVEAERGTVLTAMFVCANPTDAERDAAKAELQGRQNGGARLATLFRPS